MRAMRSACAGNALRQLGPRRQLEVGEVEPGRDRATDQAVARAGRQLGGEPGAGRDHQLRPLARGEIQTQAQRAPTSPWRRAVRLPRAGAARRAGRPRRGERSRRTAGDADRSSAARASPGSRSPCSPRARLAVSPARVTTAGRDRSRRSSRARGAAASRAARRSRRRARIRPTSSGRQPAPDGHLPQAPKSEEAAARARSMPATRARHNAAWTRNRRLSMNRRSGYEGLVVTRPGSLGLCGDDRDDGTARTRAPGAGVARCCRRCRRCWPLSCNRNLSTGGPGGNDAAKRRRTGRREFRRAESVRLRPLRRRPSSPATTPASTGRRRAMRARRHRRANTGCSAGSAAGSPRQDGSAPDASAAARSTARTCRTCAPASSSRCVAGRCVLPYSPCEPDYGHCGTDPNTGCETPLTTVHNCGGCNSSATPPTTPASATTSTAPTPAPSRARRRPPIAAGLLLHRSADRPQQLRQPAATTATCPTPTSPASRANA